MPQPVTTHLFIILSPCRCELLYVRFKTNLRSRDPGSMEVVLPVIDQDGKTTAVQPTVAGERGLAAMFDEVERREGQENTDHPMLARKQVTG